MQVSLLTIQATRMDKLRNHIEWILSHHSINHRLLLFAVVESILGSSKHLHLMFKKTLQTARIKLVECETPNEQICQYITRINRAIGTD